MGVGLAYCISEDIDADTERQYCLIRYSEFHCDV